MNTLKTLLQDLDACSDARKWAGAKSIEEVVATCHRGDWLLWLAEKVGVEKRLRVHAGGLCANTVRHLMKDERSIKAVDVAVAYGRGEAGEEELGAAWAASAAAREAADAAARAASAAAREAAAAAAWAAWAAGDAAWAAAWAAWAAGDAAARAPAASDAAWAASLLQTADIARVVLGGELIAKVNEILK